MAEEKTAGQKSSEWKAWMTAVAASIAAGIGAILAAGVIDEGTTLYVVLGVIATVAAAIGGVSASYIKGRSVVKASAASSDADPT